MRALISGAPPGADGTMKRMGRLGYACACSSPAAAAMASAQAIDSARIRVLPRCIEPPTGDYVIRYAYNAVTGGRTPTTVPVSEASLARYPMVFAARFQHVALYLCLSLQTIL